MKKTKSDIGYELYSAKMKSIRYSVERLPSWIKYLLVQYASDLTKQNAKSILRFNATLQDRLYDRKVMVGELPPSTSVYSSRYDELVKEKLIQF